MSEQKPCSLDEQKKSRPKIEDIIPKYLAGDEKKSALDFIAYLRENKMSPGWAGFTNAWKAVNKGRTICYIKLGAGSGASNVKDNKWVVAPFLENLNKYEDKIIGENLQNLLWENVFYCVQKPKDSIPPEELRRYALSYPCDIWGCAPGKDISICGKELTNICRNGNRQHFWFHDPDEVTLGFIKKLLEFEKAARSVKNNEFL